MRRPGLDALRGLAVFLVMLRHGFIADVGAAGAVGVVVFFALSGYLITGILMKDLDREGRISYGRFYVHRALRLGPALVLLLAFYLLVTLSGVLQVGTETVVRSVLYALFYVSNLGVHMGPGLDHLWTLAVEEQFYVIWPVALLLAVRHRFVPALLIGSVVVLLAAGTWTAAEGVRSDIAYRLPWMWASCLVIGAATRIYRDQLRALLGRGSTAAAWIGLVVVLAAAAAPDLKGQTYPYLYGCLAVAVGTAALTLTLDDPQVRFVRVLEPFRLLGLISYAAYLWNVIAVIAARRFLPDDATLAIGLTSMVLTVLAATVSWYTVEAVGRALRARYDARSRERAASPAPTS